MNRHLVIAGPGRSGSTLLVRLLDEIGFETGADRLQYFEAADAGLEADIRAADAPYVVKNPVLSWELRELFESGELTPESVDCLVVLVRELDAAAASRLRVAAVTGDLDAPGGLWLTKGARRQRYALAAVTYEVFLTAARYELPLIVMEYPRFARDAGYAFRRLAPVLGTRDEQEFLRAWQAVVDPARVRADDEVPVPRFAACRVALLRARRRLEARRTRARAPTP
jgi:hypothetical protein